jgi:hypothetical protein
MVHNQESIIILSTIELQGITGGKCYCKCSTDSTQAPSNLANRFTDSNCPTKPIDGLLNDMTQKTVSLGIVDDSSECQKACTANYYKFQSCT